MTALSVSKLVVRRGAFTLCIDALDIAGGETLLLVGPSGSGKSTVLDAVGGRVAMEGRIEIGGRDVTQLPPHRRPVHTCWQSGGETLFPHMNVEENVGFALRMAGVSAGARARVVREQLARVGLDGFGARGVSTLSGGQRQRVAVARALAHPAPIVLLDEVTSGLDPELRDELRAQLLSRQAETGAAMLCVSHDHREVEQWSRQHSAGVMVLRGGKVEQRAPWEALLKQPVNDFVARFVGPVNLLEGRQVGGLFEVEGVGALPRPSLGQGELYGLRPESIRLVALGDDATRVRGRVERCELDRGAWEVIVRSGERAVMVRARGWGVTDALLPGREVALTWEDCDAFLTKRSL